jgi:hypothetical protein
MALAEPAGRNTDPDADGERISAETIMSRGLPASSVVPLRPIPNLAPSWKVVPTSATAPEADERNKKEAIDRHEAKPTA